MKTYFLFLAAMLCFSSICQSQTGSFEFSSNSTFNCTNRVIEIYFTSQTPSITGTYKVFADKENPAELNVNKDEAIGGLQQFTTSGNPITANNLQYQYSASISVPAVHQQTNFWIQVFSADGKTSQVFPVTGSCSILPINLISFTISRKKAFVTLQWMMFSELNLKGFAVQRKRLDTWETVAFVDSKAAGHSGSPVAYEFKDANSFKGTTEYRLVETSMSGEQRLSETRSVKGHVNKIALYPNPSTDGRVNLVFEENAEKYIQVFDMAGRVVKHYKGVNSSLTIEGLRPGIYTVLIHDQAANENLTERLVVGGH